MRLWPFAACLAVACTARTPAPVSLLEPVDEVIEVADDAWTFRTQASHRPFVPRGVNYDHDSKGVCPLLLEEYWVDRESDVEGDFAEMAALGFNLVRIHLQLPAFLRGPGDPDPAALARLDALVESARRHRVRLIITGLGNYRRENVPAWFSALDDEAALRAEQSFWKAIASRYPNHPAIFAYDLQNEPFVSAVETNDVVSGPYALCDPDGDGPLPARGFSYVHTHYRHATARWTAWVQARYATETALRTAWPDFPRGAETWSAIGRVEILSSAARARDGLVFTQLLAAEWTNAVATSVREVDPTHLVTVGLTSTSIPFDDRHAADAKEPLYFSSFTPLAVGPAVDFVSVHVYPHRYDSGSNVVLAKMLLRGAYVGKPVVLEETFPLVDARDTEAFLTASLGSVSGWVSFYWGSTPEELRANGWIVGEVVASWLEGYSRFLAEQVPPAGAVRAPGTPMKASIAALLADRAARLRLFDRFAAADARGELMDPVLEP